MFKRDYIFFDANITTKKEALEFICEKALNLKVTNNKAALLTDFLKREKEFSTGLKDGFAIPHAKTDFADNPVLFYVRCKKPVSDWKALDDSLINHLFALIVPSKYAGSEHLKMISKLAINLSKDDFREKVKTLSDKNCLAEYISEMM